MFCFVFVLFFFFKQKTAYELRISDWSSDVCSSDLMAVELRPLRLVGDPGARGHRLAGAESAQIIDLVPHHDPDIGVLVALWRRGVPMRGRNLLNPLDPDGVVDVAELVDGVGGGGEGEGEGFHGCDRSEENRSALQSLKRIQ